MSISVLILKIKQLTLQSILSDVTLLESGACHWLSFNLWRNKGVLFDSRVTSQKKLDYTSNHEDQSCCPFQDESL